ncbi:hypothetical protein [Actinophytocola sp.]|uniref:hypothetical protein n=1 Tax=Actinophytocola sp. TaxID=1872138 RepID=UPI002D7FDD4E|nr:hypothetical protein [Actinophytocola sp.]HET9144158.1 hypothetical protein [Actinophytocola sp.]
MDDATRKPFVGEPVHYVSFGTPGGEYRSRCRAAFITELGQWVTVNTEPRASYDRSEGRPIRYAEQWFYADAAALFVMNPTGVFFNGAGPVACKHDELPPRDRIVAGERAEHLPGTWHWPDEWCTS